MRRFEIDIDNDWEWELACKADVRARVERLETEKFSRLELYEELIELMAVLEVYWKGQEPERQRETARDVRDLLRTAEALKARMQTWAREEIGRQGFYNG
jgi:hypothetical protein